MEQFTLFDFGLDEVFETETSAVPVKHKVQWNPKGRNQDLQITFVEYEGFEDKVLVQQLDAAIRGRSRILSEPFDEFIEIIGYQRFFDWTDKISYKTIIKVKGQLPYATVLSVDLHSDRNLDLGQLMFIDYRHLRFESDPNKPFIFKSVEEKTRYLNWAAKGI